MQEWTWIDYQNVLDTQDAFDSVTVMTDSHLLDLLESSSKLSPRVVTLRSPAGSRMCIGIGGEFIGMEYFDSPESEVPVTCRPRQRYTDSDGYFSCESDTIRFDGNCLMPLSVASRVLLYFFETLTLPDWVDWL
jgi:hypothetical protein